MNVPAKATISKGTAGPGTTKLPALSKCRRSQNGTEAIIAELDRSGRHVDNWAARTGFTAVSLFCMLILALMLGSRGKHLSFNNIRSMNFMRFLVAVLYVSALNFVAAAGLVESGMGMKSISICRAGTLVCLSFYLISKVLMYMFIIERAHSIRAPYTKRSKDWVWVFWTVILAAGFVTLTVLSVLRPVADLSGEEGKCRIGIPKQSSITLIVFDICANFSLTGVFLWLLRPLLAFHQTSNPDSRSYFRHRVAKSLAAVCQKIPIRLPQSEPYRPPLCTNLIKTVEWLVCKTLAGTILNVIPTIANLSLLYHMDGREQGWLCLMICQLDVTWGVCVIHWLTVDPLEVESRPTAAHYPSSTRVTDSTPMHSTNDSRISSVAILQ